VLRDVVNEMLHGVNATIRWFGSRFPDEEILSAAPASYSESSEGRRLGWGRRGVVIFTRRQVLFRSVLLSLHTLVFLAVGFACFAAYARTEDVFFLIIGILAVGSTFNRLPHQRQIWLGEIESVEVGSVSGFTLRGIRDSQTLSLNTLGHKVQFTLKEGLTDEVSQILEIRGQSIKNYIYPP
jgi:hypothetical protein